MSTLQVKGGSGPAGRTLKTLNNRNNLVSLYMRKQMDQLNKEQSFCISHLDRDKFETHDFLLQVQRKESDKHPAAIKYLGKSEMKEEFESDDILQEIPTRRGYKRRSRQKSGTPRENFDDIKNEVEEYTPRTLRDIGTLTRETGNTLERQQTFSFPNRNSLSSFTTLPALDRRESVYFQIAATNAAVLSSSDSSDDDTEPTLEMKCKDLSTKRKSSFVAWVQENSIDQQTKKLRERLKRMQIKDNPLEERRNSFQNFIQRYKSTRKNVPPLEQLHDISEDASPDYSDSFREIETADTDVMRSLLLNKTVWRKVPLTDRINSFYKRINHLKIPVYHFNSPMPKMPIPH